MTIQRMVKRMELQHSIAYRSPDQVELRKGGRSNVSRNRIRWSVAGEGSMPVRERRRLVIRVRCESNGGDEAIVKKSRSVPASPDGLALGAWISATRSGPIVLRRCATVSE